MFIVRTLKGVEKEVKEAKKAGIIEKNKAYPTNVKMMEIKQGFKNSSIELIKDQREYRTKKVSDIIAGFLSNGVGSLIFNYRDGMFYDVDGQQRPFTYWGLVEPDSFKEYLKKIGIDPSLNEIVFHERDLSLSIKETLKTDKKLAKNLASIEGKPFKEWPDPLKEKIYNLEVTILLYVGLSEDEETNLFQSCNAGRTEMDPNEVAKGAMPIEYFNALVDCFNAHKSSTFAAFAKCKPKTYENLFTIVDCMLLLNGTTEINGKNITSFTDARVSYPSTFKTLEAWKEKLEDTVEKYKEFKESDFFGVINKQKYSKNAHRAAMYCHRNFGEYISGNPNARKFIGIFYSLLFDQEYKGIAIRGKAISSYMNQQAQNYKKPKDMIEKVIIPFAEAKLMVDELEEPIDEEAAPAYESKFDLNIEKYKEDINYLLYNNFNMLKSMRIPEAEV